MGLQSLKKCYRVCLFLFSRLFPDVLAPIFLFLGSNDKTLIRSCRTDENQTQKRHQGQIFLSAKNRLRIEDEQIGEKRVKSFPFFSNENETGIKKALDNFLTLLLSKKTDFFRAGIKNGFLLFVMREN